MEGMGIDQGSQEVIKLLGQSIENMKQMHFQMNTELQSIFLYTQKKVTEYQETISKLNQLLMTTRQERDDARMKLQHVTCMTMPDGYLSHSHNQQLFASLELPNTKMIYPSNVGVTEEHFFSTFSTSNMMQVPGATSASNSDQALVILNSLAIDRTLLEEGRIVQAMEEPLLDMTPLAGPLPPCPNSFELQQFTIPPIKVEDYDINEFEGMALKNPYYLFHNSKDASQKDNATLSHLKRKNRRSNGKR